MMIHDVAQQIGEIFIYRRDAKSWIDHWSVMRLRNGEYFGDCDDYATTVLWHYYGGFFGFLWNVVILHRGQYHKFITADGQPHIVGSVDGKYFDNYTLDALPKSKFLAKTGHRYLHRYYAPVFVFYLIHGIFRS